jgi:hypothetical protein
MSGGLTGSGRNGLARAFALLALALATDRVAAELIGQAEGAPLVALRTEVFEVEQVLDAAGRVERRLVPAVELVAGDELRYAIRLHNAGAERIETGRVQVETAVPAAARFLPGSAGGAGALVEDEALTPDALLDAAALLSDPVRHATMAGAARDLARPGAADAIAELVLAAASGRPLPDPAAVEAISRGRAA